MIVKQRYNAVSNRTLYNIAGGIALLLGGVFAAKTLLHKADTPSCDARYQRGVVFSLARGQGEPLSVSELQQKFWGTDWGVLSNARVIATGDKAHPHALEVSLRAQDGVPASLDDRVSGMSFLWESNSLSQATSACLSYSVWVPKSFKHGSGGRLPGIIGGLPGSMDLEPPPNAKPFGVHVVWRSEGDFVVVPKAQNGERRNVAALDRSNSGLEPGRWIHIEQEAVLNNPGKQDGLMRVWVDGKLQVEKQNLAWRGTVEQRWIGVVGDTHYSRSGRDWMPSPANSSIVLTPLELRVQ